MNLLAGGGLSIAAKSSPMPIATPLPILDLGTPVPMVSKWAWLGANWGWILLAILLIVGIYLVTRKLVMKK